ncbi:MAG: 50S ribosomal protein L11 methyltransferase [Oscillospiraceae bacterium]|nr:50S ribosomal protein L11 methyltransferase [Oscillospiraceae bacterium]
MEWLEVSIEAHKGTEALSDLLEGMGVSGLVIEDGSDFEKFMDENRQYWDYVDEELSQMMQGKSLVKFYLSADEDGKAELERITKELEPRGYVPSARNVRDEDWENNWKQYYKPIKVGEKLLIVPEWEDAPEAEGRSILRLNPGLIFGTGTHPTTRMCLERLESYAPVADSVLDLGCGSGILSIAALCLGAKMAIGCDIDDKAPDIVMENAQLNSIGTDIYTVYAGDVLKNRSLRSKIDAQKYDLVLANIVSDVIIALVNDAAKWVKPDGKFICSGIIDGREDEVRAAVEAAGFEILDHGHVEDWHCYMAQLRKD